MNCFAIIRSRCSLVGTNAEWLGFLRVRLRGKLLLIETISFEVRIVDQTKVSKTLARVYRCFQRVVLYQARVVS